MPALRFIRGQPDRPRGHVLLYMRDAASARTVLATYVVVLPVAVDISKYIPPLLAGRMSPSESAGPSAVPWPPIPEVVESESYLERLADSRDDDLVYGGAVDSTRLDALMQATGEATQEYLRLYAQREALPAEPSGEETGAELDVDEVLYGLMGDHDRLTELVKLTGKLRDAVEGGERRHVDEALGDVRRIARHFPDKYQLDRFLAVAPLPGEKARRLIELYVERCYRVCNEDYVGLREVDAQIQVLS